MPKPARSLLFAAGLLLIAAPSGAGPLGDFAERAYQATRRANAGRLGEAELTAALREALAQGATKAVTELGRADGYWQAPRFRIPLPRPLERNAALLRGLGAGPQLDALHLAMNRAAEAAVPEAAAVFGDAVRGLSVADARALLAGPPDAVTRHFERSTGPALLARFTPIVGQVTAQSQLARQYRDLLASAGPLAAALGAPDLDAWVAQRALDGLYQRIADEEAAIRRDPAARGSELLRKAFAT